MSGERVLLAWIPPLVEQPLRALFEPQHEVEVLTAGADDPAAVAAAAARAEIVVTGAPLLVAGAPDEVLLRASAGVYQLVNAVAEGSRLILLSSMSTFERYPVDAQVSEYWAPRPTTSVPDLAALAAETVVRSVVQERAVMGLCLRLGVVGTDADAPDPRGVHVDDVAQAVQRATAFDPAADEPCTGWWVFHIVGAGRTRFPLAMAARASGYPNGGRGSTLGYRPEHDLAQQAPLVARQGPPPTPVPSRPSRHRVAVLGAGGPFGALAARALAPDHLLRLTDARPMSIVLQDPPQSPGAPVPVAYGPPHESQVVDVTDEAQVLDATRGMDVVVNLTVVRNDPVGAFRVNALAVRNVMRAAVACGVRRVVLTGPNQVFNPMNGAYWSDFDLGSDVPQRPGSHLYMLSKFVGQQIAATYAVEHDLEVVLLVYGYFTDPATAVPDPFGGHPFTVSWDDTGESMRAAVEVDRLPRPLEVVHVQGNLPHGKYRNDRAREVLRWEPRDRLDALWRRDLD